METIQNNSPKVFEQDKGKDKRIKRTRIYPPQKKYILVSKWQTPNDVLLLDRTKKGGNHGGH